CELRAAHAAVRRVSSASSASASGLATGERPAEEFWGALCAMFPIRPVAGGGCSTTGRDYAHVCLLETAGVGLQLLRHFIPPGGVEWAGLSDREILLQRHDNRLQIPSCRLALPG